MNGPRPRGDEILNPFIPHRCPRQRRRVFLHPSSFIIHPCLYCASGSLTVLPLAAASCIASVTSRLQRASCAVACTHALPVARWSSHARVSLAIGPQKSPSAQSPGVPLDKNTIFTL